MFTEQERVRSLKDYQKQQKMLSEAKAGAAESNKKGPKSAAEFEELVMQKLGLKTLMERPVEYRVKFQFKSPEDPGPKYSLTIGPECSLNHAKCSLNHANCSLNHANCSLNQARPSVFWTPPLATTRPSCCSRTSPSRWTGRHVSRLWGPTASGSLHCWGCSLRPSSRSLGRC
jgi:hypothetical protein